jgi:hypothetical protein
MARFNVTKLADNDFIVTDSVPVAEGGLGDIARSGSQEGAEQAAADFEHQYTVSAVPADPEAPEPAETPVEESTDTDGKGDPDAPAKIKK